MRGQASGISETTDLVGFSCSGKVGPFQRLQKRQGQVPREKLWTKPKSQKKTEPDEKDQMSIKWKNPSSELVRVPVLRVTALPVPQLLEA